MQLTGVHRNKTKEIGERFEYEIQPQSKPEQVVGSLVVDPGQSCKKK